MVLTFKYNEQEIKFDGKDEFEMILSDGIKKDLISLGSSAQFMDFIVSVFFTKNNQHHTWSKYPI